MALAGMVLMMRVGKAGGHDPWHKSFRLTELLQYNIARVQCQHAAGATERSAIAGATGGGVAAIACRDARNEIH